MPNTPWGRWASVLGVAAVAAGVLLIILRATGQEPGETVLSNPVLGIPGLLMIASGVGSLMVGLVGITFRKERSVLAFLVTGLVALLALLVGIDMVVESTTMPPR